MVNNNKIQGKKKPLKDYQAPLSLKLINLKRQRLKKVSQNLLKKLQNQNLKDLILVIHQKKIKIQSLPLEIRLVILTTLMLLQLLLFQKSRIPILLLLILILKVRIPLIVL